MRGGGDPAGTVTARPPVPEEARAPEPQEVETVSDSTALIFQLAAG
jgi:hypothetical protein